MCNSDTPFQVERGEPLEPSMKNRAVQNRRAELEQDRRNCVIIDLYREYYQTTPRSGKGAKRRRLLLNALKEWTKQRSTQRGRSSKSNGRCCCMMGQFLPHTSHPDPRFVVLVG